VGQRRISTWRHGESQKGTVRTLQENEVAKGLLDLQGDQKIEGMRAAGSLPIRKASCQGMKIKKESSGGILGSAMQKRRKLSRGTDPLSYRTKKRPCMIEKRI